MNVKYIFSFVIVGVAFLSGCKKSFLDVKPDTDFTSPEQLLNASKEDSKLFNGSIAGLATTMFSTGVGGTSGHDDFGQKGIDIVSDMLCSDMVLGAVNYNWYSPVARYQATIDFTRNEAYVPWRYFYRLIFGANSIIDILGGNDAVPEDAKKKTTIGQAKTIRAYAYFYLSQLYAKEYGTGTDKILPIYTSANLADPNHPKSPASEVWNLMIADLTQAITLLDGYSRKTKDEVDINVAKGLLAYVLAARGTQADWAKVETLTKDIIGNYGMTSVDALVYKGVLPTSAGFNSVATPSWMWGVDITLAQGLNLVSWWGQVDLFTYSYAFVGDPKIIDKGLYGKIREDDIRKGQFDPPNGGQKEAYDYMPINKFFDPRRVAGGQRQITTDLIYMRSDEFYLLNAEAKAQLGHDADAKAVLSNFLSTRIADISYLSSLAGKSLLDEIYLQTRIELWGEGKSYLAMKRNKATITRGSNHLYFGGMTFPYNDPQLTFVIPQAEVLNNPNLNN